MSEFSRREFLLAAAAAALAGRAAGAQSPLKIPRPGRSLDVTLVGRADDLGEEVVSFGMPLPPDFLMDAGRVVVLDEHRGEVAATTRALEPSASRTRCPPCTRVAAAIGCSALAESDV